MVKYCQKCWKLCDFFEFYDTNNITKYPDGKLNYCKKCITKDIDIFNPNTFLWILKEVNVPYIPEIWNKIVDTQVAKGGNQRAVLGKYLTKMKLRSFKKYRYNDTSYFGRVESIKRIDKKWRNLKHGILYKMWKNFRR